MIAIQRATRDNARITPATDVPQDLRLGILQMKVSDGAVKENLDRVRELLSSAARADVYLLPELWTTGYEHDSWERIAHEESPGIDDALAELSCRLGVYLAGSTVCVRDGDGALVNRLRVFSPDGQTRAFYDKGHLFPPMRENDFLTAGTQRCSTKIGDWTAALSICYDLRFPEMYRLDAMDGANLFLVVAEWPAERSETLRLLARARAVENQAYLALCNRVGMAADGTEFGGGSIVVAPDGSIIADAGRTARILTAHISGIMLAQVRGAGSVLDARCAGLDWADSVAKPEGRGRHVGASVRPVTTKGAPARVGLPEQGAL